MTTICDFFLSVVPCVITSALLESTNNIFTLMKNVTLESDALVLSEAAVKVTADGAIIDLNKKKLSGVDLQESDTIGFFLESPEVTIKNGEIDGFYYGIRTNDFASGNIVNVHMSNQEAAVLHFGTSFNMDRSTFDCIGTSCIYLDGDGPYSISNSIFKPTGIATPRVAISVVKTEGDNSNNDVSIRNNLIQDMTVGVSLVNRISSNSNVIIESNCVERNKAIGLSYINRNRIGDDSSAGTIDIKNNFITSGTSDIHVGIALDKECLSGTRTCSDVPPNVSNNCIGDTGSGPGIWLDETVIPGTVIYNNTFYNNINRGDVCQGDEATCIDTNNGYFLSQRDNDDEARARCVCPLNESNVGAGSMPVTDDEEDESSSSSSSNTGSSKKKKKNKSASSSSSSLRLSSRNKSRSKTTPP